MAPAPVVHMKAIVYCNYGLRDLLRYDEIDKADSWDEEIVIKVRAASV